MSLHLHSRLSNTTEAPVPDVPHSRLGNVTSPAEIDRDYHRNLLLMAQQHERNATALAEQVNRLTLTLTIRDNDYAEARREIARLEARLARLTRRQPARAEMALAWLVCRLEALDRWTRAWWL